MASDKSFWFRAGYALEKARRPQPTRKRTLAGLAERLARAPGRSPPTDTERTWPSADQLIDSGLAALVGRALGGWHPRRRRGLLRLLRAAAAGAGASLLLDLVTPLLQGRRELPILDREAADRMLAGIGQGLVYGGVVEPRIPGQPLIKGVLYGSAEYAVDPAGGLARVLRAYTPQGRIPPLANLLDELHPHDRAYLEHLVFGVALALLYGPSVSSSGIRLEVDNE